MKYKYLHAAVFIAVALLFAIGLLIKNQLEDINREVGFEEISIPAGANDTLPEVFLINGGEVLVEIPESTESQEDIIPEVLIEAQEEQRAKENLNQTILPQYQSKYAKNHDMAGWVKIKGTMLNLAVMYTPEDSEFYRTHYFDGRNSSYGTPFIDAKCRLNPRSDNLIIHGNSINDGTMFSTLLNYKDKSYFISYPKINFDTLYEEGTYEIIAVISSGETSATQTSALYSKMTEPADIKEFELLMKEIKEESLYDTGKTAEYGDKLITLIIDDNTAGDENINIIARKIEE